ncbi:hypothetical protein [Streptomyces sp. NPDC055013]
MDTPPVAPDVAQVLKHNRTLRSRHTAARLALAAGLFAVPFVAHWGGYDAALPVFGVPAGMFVLTFLPLRLGRGSRLRVCAYEQERAQAGPQRRELAEQAGIFRLLELKEFRGMVLG